MKANINLSFPFQSIVGQSGNKILVETTFRGLFSEGRGPSENEKDLKTGCVIDRQLRARDSREARNGESFENVDGLAISHTYLKCAMFDDRNDDYC